MQNLSFLDFRNLKKCYLKNQWWNFIWSRAWRHTPSLCVLFFSLLFSSWDGGAIMLVHVNLHVLPPFRTIAPPTPFIKCHSNWGAAKLFLYLTQAQLTLQTVGRLTSQAVQKSHKRSYIVLWLRFWRNHALWKEINRRFFALNNITLSHCNRVASNITR